MGGNVFLEKILGFGLFPFQYPLLFFFFFLFSSSWAYSSLAVLPVAILSLFCIEPPRTTLKIRQNDREALRHVQRCKFTPPPRAVNSDEGHSLCDALWKFAQLQHALLVYKSIKLRQRNP